MSDIEQAMLDADELGGQSYKLVPIVGKALDAFTALETFATLGNQTAAASLEILRSNGIKSDILLSLMIGGLGQTLDSSNEDAAAQVEKRVRIELLIERLQNPALKVGAIGEYARRIAATDKLYASELFRDAIDLVPDIADAEARFSALSIISAGLALVLNDPFNATSSKAILGISDARRRGDVRQAIAAEALGREGLDGLALEEVDDEALQKAFDGYFNAGALADALLVATAVPTNKSSLRFGLVKKLVPSVLDAEETALFPVLISALSDNGDQDDVTELLVRGLLKRDQPLLVIELRDQMLAGAYRVELGFELAAFLSEVGMARMASDLIEISTEELDALPAFEQREALALAIEAAVSNENLQLAKVFAARLVAPEVAERALSKLAKALADEGEVVAAKEFLPLIKTPRYRDVALSGVGRALVRAGDLAAGREMIEQIDEARPRDRVVAELVREIARAGSFEEAKTLVDSMEDHEYKLKSLIYIARSYRDHGNEEAFKSFFSQAVEVRDAEESKSKRDKFNRELARTMIREKDLERAEGFAKQIANDKLRSKVLAEILKQKADLSTSMEEALDLLEDFAAVTQFEEIYADVLVAFSAHEGLLEFAVREAAKLTDTMLRVHTSRKIAETQLARLDRYGYGRGKGSTRDFIQWPAPRNSGDEPRQMLSQVGEDQGLRLSVSGTLGNAYRAYGFPSLDVTVQTVRDEVPLPGKSRVSVTLAHLTPYNAKFLEDLADGISGLFHAAKFQKLIQPWVILVEEGVTTLGAVARDLKAQGYGHLARENNGIVTLRAPILVSRGAELILSGLEAQSYRLSATAGSFIAVAGKLHIHDALVTSWDEETQARRPSTKQTNKIFRPFIVGWSNSNINIGGSILDSLGYAASKSFGLAFSAGPRSVIKNIEDKKAPGGIIVDNHFHNFEYGFYTYEADDVVLVGNEYKDNVLYAIDPHDRSNRLLIALNTAYGTMAKHGIIISRKVNGSWKIGNVSYDNAGSGFMIDRDSVENLVYGNVAFANHQDGMTFFESSCNLVAANDFRNNMRSGIRIRNSWEIAVHDNLLTSNKEAAIHGYVNNLRRSDANSTRDFILDPYVPLTTFSAFHNTISRNGAGIKVNGASGFSTSENQFVHQSKSMVDGDAKNLLGQVLRYQQKSHLVLSTSQCTPRRPAEYGCRFREQGFFAGDGQASMFAEDAAGFCVEVEGSLQEASF
ncbi:right-handed parallel beta-helix repeat-containing protein [Roseibium sp.]|uniref:right-handed parallel beta-helix repeat-containing protein n=1 Tax=Roseibium sp. TaxID=1936156 RepID=UPI003A976453